MPETTPHVHDDLRGILRGDLLFDELTRALYSTDASPFAIMPAGVVVPRDEDDVCALVRYAAEQKIPLTARGAGTNVSGAALGEGLIVDFSTYQSQILEIGDDFVRVQPGVVLRELNAILAGRGRRFAPGPTTGEATAGGIVSANRSGARSFLHGYPREQVRDMRVVLDNGEAVSLGSRLRFETGESSPRLQEITTAIVRVLEKQQPILRLRRGPPLFDRCGYAVDGVVSPRSVDLSRLVAGSEGTLALITELTLQTQPLPQGEAVLLASFSSLEAALDALPLVSASQPAACDLFDRRLLTLMRGVSNFNVPAVTEALVLVEMEGDGEEDAQRRALELCDKLERSERRLLQVQTGFDPDDRARLRQVRAAVLPALSQLTGGVQALAIVEDVAVPEEALRAYLDGARSLLQAHDITAAFFVHACSAQVECWPFLDPRDRINVARLRDLAEGLYELVWRLDGTISSQHGCGLARAPWVARQLGRLYPAMTEIKSIFDPNGLFNPGKIVALPEQGQFWPFRDLARPHEPEAILQHPAVRGVGAPLPLSLHANIEQTRTESEKCHGCGDCRTVNPTSRMCPIFRATTSEPATPRAKANLWRSILGDSDDPRRLAGPEVREIADLCVNCKMCARECPSKVNIPRLMLEAKAINVAEHGMDRSDWVLARTESFARIGSALAPLCNRLLANRGVRWLLEKLFGVSRQRRLPLFSPVSFLRRAARRGWTRRPSSTPSAERPRVAYFIDIFANYNDPLIAESVVAVLQHNGIEVYVPPGQHGCGMAPLAVGDVESAREMVQRNLRLLAELVRQGYVVICSEPTAALMLSQDALALIDDPDTKLVAENTVEWTTYLWRLYEQGLLRTDFQPLELSLGHHVPCHLKALGQEAAGPRLLALIPGLRVRTIDVSCSGMAGTYGLLATNYATSLAAGQPMLDQLNRPGLLFGSTECSSCRLQMEEGSGKRTLHPAQYLALAYGLVPQNAQRLWEPIRDRVL